MSGSRSRSHGLVAVILLLTSLLIGAHPASAADRLSETRRRLQATRAKLLAVKRSDAELQGIINSLSGQLVRTQGRLSASQSDLARLEARMHGQERLLAQLEAERSARAKVVGQRARALYMMGTGAGAEALMNADSLQQFVDRTSSLDYAMRSDRVAMDDLAHLADQATKARDALAHERQVALGINRQIAEYAGQLSDVLDTKQIAEQQLSDKISAYQSEVRYLEAEQARILALIRARQSHSTGPISRRGFSWPIRGPITSPYGPRWGGFHTGIDIDCQTGDTIRAAKGGTVIASEWGGGYGNMVIIDHGNGVSTLYAHNSRLYVSQGQHVARGQAISACGETGHAYGDHLHFEVRINGQHTNPMPFLP